MGLEIANERLRLWTKDGAWDKILDRVIVEDDAVGGRGRARPAFNRLKQFRDLATRYAERAAYYQAELTIAAIVLRLR